MDREDAQRAIERHATSKLRGFADLQQIADPRLPRRGAALDRERVASASCARAMTGAAGTEVEVRHGRLVHVKDAGHPRGTTVEVRDLFGAVPARRKFLRADATEASHVAEAVTLLALARPETGFVLQSGGRTRARGARRPTRWRRACTSSSGTRASGIWRRLQGGEEWARVSRLRVAPGPADAGLVASIRLFVNGRPVRDRAVSKAILEAYRATGLRDPRPEAFLFVEVPPHLVDVNVHPAKSEVRFADPRVVFVAVQRAVREALSQATRVAPAAGSDRVREAAEVYLDAGGPAHGTPSAAGRRLRALGGGAPAGARGGQPSLFEAGAPSVLGQHRNTYIVASDGEDLLLVDQHTAHERVRFEALLARLAGREPESQLLLSPLVVDLEPRLRAGLEAYAPELLAAGLRRRGVWRRGPAAASRAAPAGRP